MTGTPPEAPPEAQRVVEALVGRNLTVGCAESLTGGLLTAALTEVPGASATVRGGVVAYASQVKAEVLGVDRDLLAREGAVHPNVALAMASGVCRALGADVGVATTGVAGPTDQDGKAVGTVFVAVVQGRVRRVVELKLSGGRAGIRRATVSAALGLLGDVVGSA